MAACNLIEGSDGSGSAGPSLRLVGISVQRKKTNRFMKVAYGSTLRWTAFHPAEISTRNDKRSRGEETAAIPRSTVCVVVGTGLAQGTRHNHRA